VTVYGGFMLFVALVCVLGFLEVARDNVARRRTGGRR
jgi:hypothetical protein